MLGQATGGIFGAVEKAAYLGERSREAQLLNKPPLCCRQRGLTRARVTATGVGPQPTKVIFFQSPPLEHQPPLSIKDKDGERPVELPTVLMGHQLRTFPKGGIVLTHQNNTLLH